ncbi:hypothetical protein HPG69_001256, partial [Diceros bicornis minor]
TEKCQDLKDLTNFFWILHINFYPGCQYFGQILGFYKENEGKKIILEKVQNYEMEHTLVLNFFPLMKEILSLDKLEAQLKACNLLPVFSKAKPSVLALCLLSLEVETFIKLFIKLLQILLLVIKHSKINDTECRAQTVQDSNYGVPECQHHQQRAVSMKVRTLK